MDFQPGRTPQSVGPGSGCAFLSSEGNCLDVKPQWAYRLKAGERKMGLQRRTKQDFSGTIPRLENREVQSTGAFGGLMTGKGPERAS